VDIFTGIEERRRADGGGGYSTAPELLHQLTDSNAKMIFIQPSLIPTLEAALASSPEYKIPSTHIILLCAYSDKPKNTPYSSMDEIYGPQRRPRRFPADVEKETAYLCYSSGTTGRAKGVMTSYHNMTSQLQAVNTVYEPLTPDDVVLGILPFSHIYGLTLLVHQPLTRGSPVVVLPKFDEVQVLEAIQKVSQEDNDMSE
jgi:acyl-CoA synthetase (AMP-forming)/AMP-acid ligase II